VSLAHTDTFIIPADFSTLASLEANSLFVFTNLSSSNPPLLPFPTKPMKIFDINTSPNNYKDVIACPDAPVWHAAMQHEYDGLHEHHVFEEATLPPSRKLIGLHWVYTHKFDPEGNIIQGKEKAHLVVQGFSQRPDDYGETYAPVCKLTSIHIILAYSAYANLEIYQFDAKCAFLNALIGHHDIYCGQIPGFPLPNPHTVYHILRALYGLHQSAYEWYTLLCSVLENLGFTCCEVDHGVFIGRWSNPPLLSISMPTDSSDLIMLIPIHVNDGLAATNSIELWKWLITALNKSFEITDLGPVALYLGICMTHDCPCHTLWLSQQTFVTNLLASYHLLQSQPQSTPLRHSLHLLPPTPHNSLSDIADCDITAHYQALVGSLTYLAVCTRPDLAYTTMALGQFNANPTRAHLLAAKGVLHYLIGTVDYSLEYGTRPSSDDPMFGAYTRGYLLTNADWATDQSDWKSVSGYLFYLFCSLVSWSAVKQKTIALSSTESEYMAMAHTMKEALWLRLFLSNVHLPMPHPFPLLCNNVGAMDIANLDSTSSRSKHIDIRYHFIREHLALGSFLTSWVPTSDMTADILTKPLGLPLHTKHMVNLGLISH
jgi:hypothetical protein